MSTTFTFSELSCRVTKAERTNRFYVQLSLLVLGAVNETSSVPTTAVHAELQTRLRGRAPGNCSDALRKSSPNVDCVREGRTLHWFLTSTGLTKLNGLLSLRQFQANPAFAPWADSKQGPIPAAPPSNDNQGAKVRDLVVAGESLVAGSTTSMPPPSTLTPATTPTTVAIKPAVILLCTANAAHSRHRLRLEEELRAIDDALQRSRRRDLYAPHLCLAVTFTKVLHELDDYEPTFVHFSGHGDRSGNLILKGERSEELQVPPARIAELLAALPKRPLLVTFATCHSRSLAQVAAQHAGFAIGFSGGLADESAPLFSATLYERLASREVVDVPRAFKLARIACQAEGHESVLLGQLFEHPGREVGR